jgi:hypothetical protein
LEWIGEDAGKIKGFFFIFLIPGVTKAQINARNLINEILRRKPLPFNF